jgi:pimeloyl-ACP methyl ester carboxylesterase
MMALKGIAGLGRAVILAISALLAVSSADAQDTLPRFEPVAEGEDFPVNVPGPRYQRGYLLVAQQAEDPDGLVLRLPVIRIRARNPEPGLAPVLFMPGGPGTGSLSAARFPGAYPWTENRDLIVMGRRGTRNAQPSLQCSEIGPALAADGDAAQARLFAALDACRTQLESQGVVLEAYNSDASAADIEALRQVLGEDQLALFALSYGTRLALTYARDYPGRVEAMVLDSPLPHSAKYDDAYPGNVEAALRRAAALCAADEDCTQAYPDLEQRFFAAVAEAPLSCADSKTAPPCQRRLATAAPLFSAEDIARAPQRMDQAIRGITAGGASGGVSDFDWGVRLSVWCSEALPFSRRADGRLADSFGGLDGAVFQPATCERWGVGSRPAASLAPTLSDVPTLILAGEFDVLTPPAWGIEAARTLSRSRVITLPAGFHTETTSWDGDGCAMSLAAAFFARPDAILDGEVPPDCIAERAYPEFVLP